MRSLPSKEYLRECLAYDELDGLLFWKLRPRSHFPTDASFKMWNKRFPGTQAFCAKDYKGYMRGDIDGSKARAHRVIFKYHHGYEPEQVDHIDHVRDNNRISNLRAANQKINGRNQKKHVTNKTGFANVSFSGSSKYKYRVIINFEGKRRHFGYFNCIGQAVKTAANARRNLGFSDNHGK